MKKIMLLSAVMGSLISVNAFAHNIQPNQLLANVTVSDKGEITLDGNGAAVAATDAMIDAQAGTVKTRKTSVLKDAKIDPTQTTPKASAINRNSVLIIVGSSMVWVLEIEETDNGEGTASRSRSSKIC